MRSSSSGPVVSTSTNSRAPDNARSAGAAETGVGATSFGFCLYRSGLRSMRPPPLQAHRKKRGENNARPNSDDLICRRVYCAMALWPMNFPEKKLQGGRLVFTTDLIQQIC
jgi:hypothetical protein